MTPLRNKPVIRRVGQMVVEIDAIGVTLRRYRGRRRIELTWEQVAGLSGLDEPITAVAEKQVGMRELRRVLGIENLRPAIVQGGKA